MSKPRKKAKKTQNIFTWLRKRISPYDFGVKTKAGKPAHVNKNDDVLYHFQRLRMGWHGRRLSRLKNIDMTDHFEGNKTYYFTADGRSAVSEVLVNIDIDCHGSGSLAGAIAFAEHLKATLFSNLYYETSTNGNGVHGYIVVVKGDLGDQGFNSALSMLDSWLKHELSLGKWDVENVEVKGQAPQFGWGMHKLELKTYRSGQLAKLPRGAMKRADELRGTTHIKVNELRRLRVPAAVKVESGDSVVSEVGGVGGAAVSEVGGAGGAAVSGSEAAERSVVSEEKQSNKSVVSVKKERKRSGSISGRHFGDDELAKLKSGYLSLAKDLIGDRKLVATGRKVVTAEDLAVFLMLLRFFTLNMNVDGSLPTARWRDMWLALYGAGDAERGWCHHRYARMRNFLDEEGLLSWEDEDFVVGVVDDAGRFVPGKAAKWKAGEELMKMFEVQVVEQADVVEEEKKEEEKTILYVCSPKAQEQQEEKEEERATLYGQSGPQHPTSTQKPRQSESFRKLLDDMGIWVPLTKPRFVGYAWQPMKKAA